MLVRILCVCVCASDMLNICVSNVNGRFLTMHHSELIGHLKISISLMMKPNNVWKALGAERGRKVNVHKTLNCVTKRKVHQNKEET
jgi:hypothetical protein